MNYRIDFYLGGYLLYSRKYDKRYQRDAHIEYFMKNIKHLVCRHKFYYELKYA